ncbi:hypothetical protein ACHMW9_22665 [Mesorhizobium terrae]
MRRTVIHLEQKTAETELRLGGWGGKHDRAAVAARDRQAASTAFGSTIS